MRYELDDEELLEIKQDQIDRDLRFEQALLAELDAAYPADHADMPRAHREDGIQERIDLVRGRLKTHTAEAKKIEKRLAKR